MTLETPEPVEGGARTETSPVDLHRAQSDAPASGTLGTWQRPDENRSRRSLVTASAALGIAVGFAVVLGLLIALFANSVSGNSSHSRTTPPALALPSAPGGSTAGATVPNDWIETTSNRGIVFRAPPGWTQRTDASVDFRVAQTPSGPGVDQVGVGLTTSTTDPNAAAVDYATSTYSAQNSYLQQPATDEVSARSERGRQVTVTYVRDGTPVLVVIRAFPTPRGVLLVVARAAMSDEQLAGRLAGAADASIRLS